MSNNTEEVNVKIETDCDAFKVFVLVAVSCLFVFGLVCSVFMLLIISKSPESIPKSWLVCQMIADILATFVIGAVFVTVFKSCIRISFRRESHEKNKYSKEEADREAEYLEEEEPF